MQYKFAVLDSMEVFFSESVDVQHFAKKQEKRDKAMREQDRRRKLMPRLEKNTHVLLVQLDAETPSSWTKERKISHDGSEAIATVFEEVRSNVTASL